MSYSLTPKGEFALELIRQGLHPTHSKIDQLWKQREKSSSEKKVCPTCGSALGAAIK